ncbi:MAG: MTH1187 family thiamine-binding protein [Chitinivibrionales bacterium]|nr:MTH1187 family thiamine-binding protein [Chitinivibrionales bacterium]
MLAEISFIPVGGNSHISEDVAEAVKVIAESGLAYQLTPTATCIEGEWDQVMETIGKARKKMLDKNSHLITMIKMEDDADEHNKLQSNMESISEKMGSKSQTYEEKPPEALVTPKV